MDRAQRRGRGPLAGRRAGPARGRGRRPARTTPTPRRQRPSRRVERPRVGDGFDPFDVIRTVDNAYSQTGGLTMLTGNLAPKGAVVKTAGVSPKMLKHTGPGGDLRERDRRLQRDRLRQGQGGRRRRDPLRRAQGRARACRRCSPPPRRSRASAWTTSAPWSPTAGSPAGPPARRSATSAPRRPSAARSACSKDGDIIDIDIPNGVLSVRLSDEELAERRAAWTPPQAQGHVELPRPLRQDGHQRRYRGDPQVGLTTRIVPGRTMESAEFVSECRRVIQSGRIRVDPKAQKNSADC